MISATFSETVAAPPAPVPLPAGDGPASHPIEIPLLDPLFDALPVAIMVLNEKRQLVYANSYFATLMDDAVSCNVLGKQPGQVLNCVHASEMSAGCGASSHCQPCGTLRAALGAQNGRETVCESRMTVYRNGKPVAIDLRLWARPFDFGAQRFSLLSALDVSDEKRRQVLERIFFHDIANSSMVISGFAELIGDSAADDADEVRLYAGHMAEASRKLADEIAAQRQLLAAERGDLHLAPQQVRTDAMVNALVNLNQQQSLAQERTLRLDPASETHTIWSDPALLGRVLQNMVRNALEASAPGDTVTVGCRQIQNKLCFWVHNPQHISPRIQRQIFKRSFSTKGENRGLGTYSMKLLSEGYLEGTVTFSSSAAAGTTFLATYPFDRLDSATHRAHPI